MSQLEGRRIHIVGIVQGVGFRPFVYGLASRFALKGWVRNTSAGVDIEVDGFTAVLNDFVTALRDELPPLAQIDELTVTNGPANGFTQFEIVHSEAVAGAFQPISPDVSICPDCLREMFDPNDRRYRYPFINCTNCGPRFTIIKDIPYDRPLTTMAGFAMCDDCRAEYENPLDRRFHAQPVACPVCGPQVWLEDGNQSLVNGNPITDDGLRITAHREDAIQKARQLLAEGKILAVKGLGGFHLACDALNETAVTTLRQRKLRVDKPFALMMLDVAAVEQHCFVNNAERELLESRERPIVILQRRPDSPIVTQVAPNQNTIGVMLPYTPLHYLLLGRGAGEQGSSKGDSAVCLQPSALVMTSGNLSEEPIATGNEEARERLARLADAFLMHDRDIHVRCDDSVVRVVGSWPLVAGEDPTSHQPPATSHQLPVRRSRGYAPFPVRLPWDAPPILATGAELKNTFCLVNGRYAFLSHHIGDMENYETLQSFEQGVDHFEKLFRVQPELIAYDLHPNYMATRYALARAEREGIPAIGVQHHHAHIAAGMAEHGLTGERKVIGVSFDGTGYGDDGAIWGGEFLVADYGGYERPYHLQYIPLPGGDKAVREPWRVALAWLQKAELGVMNAEFGLEQAAVDIVLHQIEKGINAPPTSSMGRLFDGVAALAGLRQTVNYEAQAAIEFEQLADPNESGAYPFAIHNSQFTIHNSQLISPIPLIQALVTDQNAGISIPTMSARFHNGVAAMVLDVCRLIRDEQGLTEVVLSGGVWQNVTLLTRAVRLLRQDGFTVYVHEKVPPNDGGLALGQATVAAITINNE
ncbi:MAG: carbamoyltransferase HypF [Ardenticatenaceae bacterium]|nr:carbamoyltransferase HypF [Ardenticatenaceae bacterium]MCB9442965.1 carbamoyltransferase HypF [Ardenticatenaceae bacterium]